MRKMISRAVLMAFLATAGCERVPCEGITRSCLSITLTGTGQVDAIAFALTQKSGQIKQGYDKQGACTLPCAWEMLPPEGVDTADIKTIEMGIFYDGKLSMRAKLPPFDWPTGSHKAVTYDLGVLKH